ncbi:glycosyltransferase family 61 protein [Methylobacterium isbiliense]|nr:glycosyltransferase family 61 protein [Methylobacterium isbiliense]MDN3626109.1 glycosyltransferase family 61 protein [Methylobacterium isbiliense]
MDHLSKILMGGEVKVSRVTSTVYNFEGHRTLLAPPKIVLPAVETFNNQSEPPPAYTREIEIRTNKATLEGSDLILFPKSGCILESNHRGYTLIEESTWHSDFRSDPDARITQISNRIFLDQIDFRECEEDSDIIWGPFWHHYFHWIIDVLPRLHASMKDRFKNRKTVLPFAAPGSMQAILANAYGVRLEDIHSQPQSVIRFSNSRYFAFDSHETLGSIPPGIPSATGGAHHFKGWTPDFFEDLYERAKTIVRSSSEKHSPRRIYVSRRDAPTRKCRNEAEIVNLLLQHGFEIVCPGELNLYQQIITFQDADIIIGLHGAGLTNIVWAPRSARVLEIMPSGYNDIGYRFIAGLRGMEYHALMATMIKDPNLHGHEALKHADCRVDMHLFSLALSRILMQH